MKVFKNQEFRTMMCELATLLQPHTYVEMGCKVGYTFNAMAPLVKRAVAVDKLAAHIARIKPAANVETFLGTTDDFIMRWEDPVDMVFIDANHRCDAVLSDFTGILPYLRDGTGLAFLHDTHPMSEELLRDDRCSSAWLAADTIRRRAHELGVEIVTIPGPYAGLSIIRKSRRQLSWRR